MTFDNPLSAVYVASAFAFEIVLTLHFAVRRWRLDQAVRWGRLVYLLGIPACLASIVLLLGGTAWYFWLAGFLFLAWAAFGYTVEYIRKNQAWRSPFNWRVGGPYLALYLGTTMFYWWPLARINKPLWIAFGALFVLGTVLNVTSHGPQSRARGVKPA